MWGCEFLLVLYFFSIDKNGKFGYNIFRGVCEMTNERRDVELTTLYGVRLFFSGREKKNYTTDEIVELIDRIAMGKELDANGLTFFEAAELLRRYESAKAGNVVEMNLSELGGV